MRIGVVAEGVTDFMVIEEVLRLIDPSIEAQRLQPDTTLMSGRPNGWRGVRAWCNENGPRVRALLRGVKGQELDGLVVHVDCSMAGNVGAQRPCPPANATASALRPVVVGWLGINPLPPWLVLALPSQTSATWLVAALAPPYTPPRGRILECDLRAEDELPRRRELGVKVKNGAVKSPARCYPPLVQAMGAAWAGVKAACGQAAQFEADLRGAVAAVLAGNGP